jgi:nucleotide-binding universal stress UspA family protein
MKKILVPIDFSHRSISALELAAEIAKKSKGQIHLVHILTNPFVMVTSPEAYPLPALEMSAQYDVLGKLQKSSQANLNSLKEKPPLKGLKVETGIITGSSVYKEILNYADSINPGLIVMGTNGTRGFTEIFLGTNAERIIRFTAIPVLVVGSKLKKPEISKIVFPSLFDQDTDKVFPFVKEFAKLFKAKIHLLRINTKEDFVPTKQVLDKIRTFAKHHKGSYEIAVKDAYEVDEGIVSYAKEIKADLIALGVHRRRGPSRFFTDRITEGVLRLTGIPVLGVDKP